MYDSIIEMVNKELDNDKCGKFKADTYDIGVAVKQKRDGNANFNSDHINVLHVGSAY